MNTNSLSAAHIKNLALAILVAILTFISCQAALAAIEQRQFDDPQLSERYSALIEELRCLVCQNQNLADSDASLAKDLRDKTAEMLIAGKTDDEILDYMSDRYGDFVLYRPPFRLDTAALWLGPLILLLLVIVLLVRHLFKRQQQEILKPTHSGDEAQRAEVRNIMKNAPRLDD